MYIRDRQTFDKKTTKRQINSEKIRLFYWKLHHMKLNKNLDSKDGVPFLIKEKVWGLRNPDLRLKQGRW